MRRPLRIAITTGDQDGIGTEVVAKALAHLKPQAGVQFFLWRSPQCPNAHLRKIDSQFKRLTVATWPEALRIPFRSHKEILDINSLLPPAQWVEISAKAALFGNLDALATAPLSKISIQQAGFKDIGHTDILKRVTRAENVFMAFFGARFHVVLATGHLPIKKISEALTADCLEKAIRAANEIRPLLGKSQMKRPVAVLGLNPHAGEGGLIGEEEARVIIPTIENLRKSGIAIVGPLVPDAALFKANWTAYSVFVAIYHDQGLIPFKMIHGQSSGVHVTLGLPFVRTSVDHGTAKSLFGKNKANAASMKEALEWAIRLSKERVS